MINLCLWIFTFTHFGIYFCKVKTPIISIKFLKNINKIFHFLIIHWPKINWLIESNITILILLHSSIVLFISNSINLFNLIFKKHEKSNINENPTNCKQRKLGNDDYWLTKTQVWFKCQIFTSYHSIHEKFILIQKYPLSSNIIFMVSICLKHCNLLKIIQRR